MRATILFHSFYVKYGHPTSGIASADTMQGRCHPSICHAPEAIYTTQKMPKLLHKWPFLALLNWGGHLPSNMAWALSWQGLGWPTLHTPGHQLLKCKSNHPLAHWLKIVAFYNHFLQNVFSPYTVVLFCSVLHGYICLMFLIGGF